MEAKRIDEIYEKIGAIKASIGDLPETGAEPLLLARLRKLTDNFDEVKILSSEVRRELNEVEKALRAMTAARNLKFRSVLLSAEVQALTGQDAKKARAWQVVAEEMDVDFMKLADQAADLNALSDVIEYRSSAVRTTISNLRKEWEMIHIHKGMGEGGSGEGHLPLWPSAESPVEGAVKEGVLEIEVGQGGISADASGVQRPEPDPGSVHIDDVLDGLDTPD